MVKQTRNLATLLFTTLTIILGIVGVGVFLLVQNSTPSAAAAPPTTMNFQGRLASPSGTVVADGLYNMQFRLYSASSGGTALWTETRETTNRVQVTNGLFSVQLGAVTPLNPATFDSANLYFEMTMATPATATCSTAACASWESPMTPRNKLATSAYAFNATNAENAKNSDTLDGLDSTAFAAASGSANYIQNATDPQAANFNVTGSGKVGGTLTVGTGVTRGVIARTVNVGRHEFSNLVVLNSDGGSNRAAFYAASSNGNSFEAGSTSGWSTRLTTSASNVGMIIQGASGQTADMLQVQDSTGSSVVKVDAIGNMTLAANKTITMVGGATSTRPASPSEGMIYFDSETDELLVFANASWQPLNGASGGAADGKTATKIVAATNSPQVIKDAADYVTDGTGDQVEINSALVAATGGNVYLAEGTYVVNASITIPNNTSLQGSGTGTEIQAADVDANLNLITNTTTYNGTTVSISNIKLNGRNDLNTAGVQRGIYLNGMGNETTKLTGASVTRVVADSFRGSGVYLNNTFMSSVSDSTWQNSSEGIYLSASNFNTVNNNRSFSNTSENIYIFASNNNVVDGNIIDGTSSYGIRLYSADFNTVQNNEIRNSGVLANVGSDKNNISHNIIRSSASSGMDITGEANSIVGNTIADSTSYGINIGSGSIGSIISSNDVSNSGGSTNNNGIRIQTSDDSLITGNRITDTSATSLNIAIYIINVGSDNTYVSNNTLGGGSISDAGTNTIFANQLDASGKLIVRSSGGFAVQNTTGGDVLNVDSTTSILTVSGEALFSAAANSTTAVVIQNSTSNALFTADTVNSRILIGSAVNGIEFSANGMVLSGTARGTDRLTVSAEYPGLTFRGDGTNNTGNLTSDFCSQPLGINASACSTGIATNYYEWTTSETTTQDYDLYFKLRYPDRASQSANGGVTAFTMQGFVTDIATDSVNATLYKGGTTCGTYDIATTNATWTTNSMIGAFATCDFAAGEEMIIKINLAAGENNFARVGDIELTYRSER